MATILDANVVNDIVTVTVWNEKIEECNAGQLLSAIKYNL